MKNWKVLKEEVAACNLCNRLHEYTKAVAETKVKRFKHWPYWGKPVPSFGDPHAKILLIGLAPAAHGANRTGRMFTGDSSGDWLTKALFETGFANKPTSEHIQDGLKLKDIVVSASVRCAPPANKPLPEEIGNCSNFLLQEIEILNKVEVFLVLGHLAFNNFCKLYQIKNLTFKHNTVFELQNGKKLLCSYHPSKQNTQTGKLKWPEWLAVFQHARKLISTEL